MLHDDPCVELTPYYASPQERLIASPLQSISTRKRRDGRLMGLNCQWVHPPIKCAVHWQSHGQSPPAAVPHPIIPPADAHDERIAPNKTRFLAPAPVPLAS